MSLSPLPDHSLQLAVFRSDPSRDTKININFQILKSGFYAFLVSIKTNQYKSLVL